MEQVQKVAVKTYFERAAEDFDSIYSGKKSAFMRMLDKVLRKDMYDRFRLTLEECDDDAIRTVLDIGTGSGRFCFPLAKNKDKVVGIDFSQPMIELAKQGAKEEGVAERCEFHVGDFLDSNFEENFDAILAIGLFDYIKDSSVFLKKMREKCNCKIIATFPTLWTWRLPIRWVRLNLKGCPVYFFTKRNIRKLYAQAGLKINRFERVGHIYFVVASPAEGHNA